MAMSPVGFTPPVPGMTKTEGVSPAGASPMSLLSMLMGNRPQGDQTAGDKMAQVVQLLREVAKTDPKIGMVAGEALRVLIEGPSALAGTSGPPGPTAPGPAMGGAPGGMPMMGPGGMPPG